MYIEREEKRTYVGNNSDIESGIAKRQKAASVNGEVEFEQVGEYGGSTGIVFVAVDSDEYLFAGNSCFYFRKRLLIR